MNADQLFALLPLVALASGIVMVMLIAAFARSHVSVSRMTAVTLLITMACLPLAANKIPISVTTLLIVDGFGLLFCGIILAAALSISLMSYPYWQVRNIEREEFYLLLMIATLGALVLVLAKHMVSFILGLEMLGIALFAMAAYNTRLKNQATYLDRQEQSDRSLEAGLKYLVLSALASALLLFGMALIYLETGLLGFSHTPFSAVGGPSLIFYGGTALMLAGIGFKLSLFPFHLWTPDVYEGAPAPVTSFVATISKGAIFAVTLRYFVASESLANPMVFNAVALIAAASMLAGNWLALMQQDLKRLLAYSSIAHLGYLMIAFLTLQTQSTRFAIEASSVYVITYMVTSLVAFGIVIMLSNDEKNSTRETSHISQYHGLFWRHPALATALAVAMLSLAGIPLTLGFVGKFYLLSAGAEAGLWWMVGTLITGSAIGLFYYLRVITALFKTGASKDSQWDSSPMYATSTAILAVLTVNILVFGVFPQPLLETVQILTEGLSVNANLMTQAAPR
jgi:NADH-quinone oxidoreductase subunit N